jgi:hypothetical protein
MDTLQWEIPIGAWMFGDNQSVVISSSIPHSLLSSRRNVLSLNKMLLLK